MFIPRLHQQSNEKSPLRLEDQESDSTENSSAFLLYVKVWVAG